MKRMYLIGGLPGSGKSTLASQIEDMHYDAVHFEADQYFVGDDGKYVFDRSKIKDAHQWCQNQVREAAVADTPVIIVANTFIKKWELEVYQGIAQTNGYELVYIMFDPDNQTLDQLVERNQHGVPPEKIAQMYWDWEH